MKDSKTGKFVLKAVKVVDKTAAITDRAKNTLIRSSVHVQNLTDDGQTTPGEYAGNMVHYSVEDIATEASHIVVDSSRKTYRTGRTAACKIREKRKKALDEKEEPDDPDEPDKETEDPPADGTGDYESPDQPDPEASPEAPLEEDVPPHAEGSEGHKASKKGPSKGEPMQSKDEGDHAQKEAQSNNPAKKKNQAAKPSAKKEKTATQPKQRTERTAKVAKRSVKSAQKTIKSAELSPKTAVKAAKETTHTTQKTAQAAAKVTQKAIKIAKEVVQAIAKAVKGLVAVLKELASAIAAGGWVAVVIILVVMLLGLVAGACFGIFFTNEDTDSSLNLRSVVQEINADYQESLDTIKYMTVYDRLATTNQDAAWPQVLAVFSAKIYTNPTTPPHSISIDDAKRTLLKEIFWKMNRINYRLETEEETVVVEEVSDDGKVIEVERTQTITVLYIDILHVHPSELAQEYGFSEEQKRLLEQLLKGGAGQIWEPLLRD